MGKELSHIMFAQVRAPTEDRTSITMHPLLDEHGNEIGQVPIGNNIGQVGGNLVKVVMINTFFLVEQARIDEETLRNEIRFHRPSGHVSVTIV